MMRKVVVTGGCGFIGSYLTEILAERGFECVVADINYHNNQHTLSHLSGKVRFSNTDITDRRALGRLFEEFRPEHVFHLAAHHFIPFCNRHPLQAIETNIAGTQNIADCCAEYGVKRLFFASTAAVYGISEAPHRECETPDPTDIYGVTKAAGEKIVTFLARESQVAVRIGRYFNAVGKRETNPHVVPEIISQLKSTRSRPTVRLGNISPKRDYIHAADLAGASFVLLNAPTPDPLDIVNIGSGLSYSVQELVERFSGALGIRIEILTDPERQRKSDRMNLCADNTRLRSIYGWSPRFTLDDAVSELAGELLPAEAAERSYAFAD